VDETSASASEIISGAVQDWDRGLIVGRRTFGKGLVQKPLNLLDGSMIRLTISRYYTPSGRSIQKPYSEGKYEMKRERLSKEFIERYNERKLIHEDSLLFPDSLRKATKILKRMVYGGGGIMPDYYVPMDTAAYSSYFRKVVAKGILNKIALQYVDKEKKNLLKLYPTFDKFKSHFQVQQELQQEGIAEAEREKIPFVADEYEKSKPFMMIYLKAIIARDIWTVTEYFQVINEQNEIYNKAVDILRSKTIYDELLK
jgi:carboxyl-terminal processing protease